MKKTLHFETVIDAPRKVVWDTMLEPDSYRQWTREFTEGSYFEGSWEKGERIRFLDPRGSGMSAEIAENNPQEFISVRHLGFIVDGVEDTESEEIKAWAPAYENYRLSDAGKSTKVEVDIDVTPEYEEMMSDSWPRALDMLKSLSEGEAR